MGRGTVPRGRKDEGAVLLEILLLAVIVPMLMLSIGVGIYMAFKVSTSVVSSVTGSSDAQVAAAIFTTDVANAALVTPASTPSTQCGTDTQILGLSWGTLANGQPANVVSYATQTDGPQTLLVRNFCSAGYAGVPTNTQLVATDASSSDVGAQLLIPSGAGATWVSAAAVGEVTLQFNTSTSDWPVDLVAYPVSAQNSGGT
jgi:hypothetical protein